MTEDVDAADIPKERDRATGETGDLGVWPDDVGQSPLEVWDGDKAVLTHFAGSLLGEHFEPGDDIVVVFSDRALECTVDAVDTGEGDG